MTSPVALALCSAFLFAVAVQLHNLGLRHIDSRRGTLISICSSAALYWMLSPWFLETWYWFTTGAALFATIGLFRPFLSANFAMAGIRFLGPTLSTTLASIAPLFSALFAIALLEESMTASLMGGTFAIVTGVVILTYRGNTTSMWPLWALSLPLGAAILRALAHAVTKLGLDVVPEPLFAGLVGYSVSLLVGLIVASVQHARIIPSVRWSPGMAWFLIGGIINGISLWSLNTALQIGQVITVVPVVSVSPVISFLLGYFIFRKERFTSRIVIAIVLIVPAIVIIARSN
ncbi:MAG: DMT family transporter [Gammaproteobacteria bacterium]|nr:DMT family transporter [Gammaproteobacteria bacterium]RTZ63704.1 MAG: hypothetical protein DSZ34_08020 [Gammaproteobacteria bacterium]